MIVFVSNFYPYSLHLVELFLLKCITTQEHYSKIFWVQNLTSLISNYVTCSQVLFYCCFSLLICIMGIINNADLTGSCEDQINDTIAYRIV